MHKLEDTVKTDVKELEWLSDILEQMVLGLWFP
jgi:hypothetical protein